MAVRASDRAILPSPTRQVCGERMSAGVSKASTGEATKEACAPVQILVAHRGLDGARHDLGESSKPHGLETPAICMSEEGQRAARGEARRRQRTDTCCHELCSTALLAVGRHGDDGDAAVEFVRSRTMYARGEDVVGLALADGCRGLVPVHDGHAGREKVSVRLATNELVESSLEVHEDQLERRIVFHRPHGVETVRDNFDLVTGLDQSSLDEGGVDWLVLMQV